MYEDQVITDVNPRYGEFADKYGWAVRRLLTFGMHVHVGIDSKEKAVAVHDEIRKYLPLFLSIKCFISILERKRYRVILLKT
jgi:carboxylate-amine ligase